jgi:hypothetical protein
MWPNRKTYKAGRKLFLRVFGLPDSASYLDVAQALYDNGTLMEFGGERRAPETKSEAVGLVGSVYRDITFHTYHVA